MNAGGEIRKQLKQQPYNLRGGDVPWSLFPLLTAYNSTTSLCPSTVYHGDHSWTYETASPRATDLGYYWWHSPQRSTASL